jgi:hypothetical protein
MLVCEKMFFFKDIKTAYLIDCRVGLYGEKNGLKKKMSWRKVEVRQKNGLEKKIG